MSVEASRRSEPHFSNDPMVVIGHFLADSPKPADSHFVQAVASLEHFRKAGCEPLVIAQGLVRRLPDTATEVLATMILQKNLYLSERLLLLDTQDPETARKLVTMTAHIQLGVLEAIKVDQRPSYEEGGREQSLHRNRLHRLIEELQKVPSVSVTPYQYE